VRGGTPSDCDHCADGAGARFHTPILPALSFEQALEGAKTRSISGLLPANAALFANCPFRSPCSISDAGLIGDGSIPKPGGVSPPHPGALPLDELPELEREAQEVLRQPPEDGKLTASVEEAYE
jgi:magnesium chelatase family protein